MKKAHVYLFFGLLLFAFAFVFGLKSDYEQLKKECYVISGSLSFLLSFCLLILWKHESNRT